MFHVKHLKRKHYKQYKPKMQLLTPKALNEITTKSFSKRNKFYKDIITFDIETTTIDKAINFMYIFMVCINGKVYYHYDWAVFISFVQYLQSFSKEFIIWVHNLSFEFAFIQSFFNWEKVFCSSAHKVIFAKTKNVTFRCTYFMTNLSLAKIPKVFGTKTKKLVGDLDYTKIRLPKITPLTNIEKCYCENDVIILFELIEKMIEMYGNFNTANIPYTSTGFTRKHLRDKAKHEKQYGILRNIVKECSVTDLRLYHMLQRAFAGGYTHLNYIFVREFFNPVDYPQGVRSRDKKSFYPSIMCKKKFPRKFFRAKPEKIFDLIQHDYAVIMDIHFLPIKDKKGKIIKKGLTAKTSMTTISEHKCNYLQNADVDNGRIYSAEICTITITEQDFEIIQLYYDIGKISIGKCYAAKKRYLPKVFVETVLDLYEKKTTLKDVKGVEQEYQRLKALLNSLYGCCVTDIIQPIINYIAETFEFKNQELKESNEIELLEKYKDNFKSLLLYQTGVYVTAYCRNEILKENWLLGENRVIYNDTDSTKYLWDNETEEIFEKCNQENIKELKTAMNYHKIDFERTKPKDIKGNEHQLGEMSIEETYRYFKSLGAKRYITSDGKEIHCTIAGLPKKSAEKFFYSGYDEKYTVKGEIIKGDFIGAPTIEQMFNKFTNQMYVPSEIAGKNTHYYTLPRGEMEFTDYLGNKGKVFISTGISLIPQSFEMNLSKSYQNFLSTHTEITGFSHCERFENSKALTRIKTYWEDLESGD